MWTENDDSGVVLANGQIEYQNVKEKAQRKE